MKTNNPFESQHSAQDKLNQSRARLRLAVFAAFGVSLLVIVPLLVQGCKRQEEPVPPAAADTNMPVAEELTNFPPLEVQHTNVVLPPLTVPADTNIMIPAVVPTPAETVAATTTEYTVAKGDSFYTIGRKLGISTKAIQDANPGVDSTRLKIGQKLNIPAAPATGGAVAAAAPAGGETVYTVKSGDTLMKIAKQYGTTYKAIKAANGLTTDRIRVGQKLKIPVKEAAPVTTPVVEPAPAPTSPPPPSSLPVLLPPPTTTK